ncbi:hypothetical protein D3C81_1932320 [compost metagenome]
MPPSPATEPTDLPLKMSPGRVWMLPIAIWKPNSTKAMVTTAHTGSVASTAPSRAGAMIAPPRVMTTLRALSTLQPAPIRRPDNQPPPRLPIIAPT